MRLGAKMFRRNNDSMRGRTFLLLLEQLEDRIVLDGAVADVQDVQDQTPDDSGNVDSLGWIYTANGWWYEDNNSGWWWNQYSSWYYNQNTGWWFQHVGNFDYWYSGPDYYYATELSTGKWFWFDSRDNNTWEIMYDWNWNTTDNVWEYNDFYYTYHYGGDSSHWYSYEHWTDNRYHQEGNSWILDPLPGWSGETLHFGTWTYEFIGGKWAYHYEVVGTSGTTYLEYYVIPDAGYDPAEVKWGSWDSGNTYNIDVVWIERNDWLYSDFSLVQPNTRIILYDGSPYSYWGIEDWAEEAQIISRVEHSYLDVIGIDQHGGADSLWFGGSDGWLYNGDEVTHWNVSYYYSYFDDLDEVMLDDGMFQIWECSVAGAPGSYGNSLTNTLSLYMNAYVAASYDTTAFGGYYGDWCLEYVAYHGVEVGWLGETDSSVLWITTLFTSAFDQSGLIGGETMYSRYL